MSEDTRSDVYAEPAAVGPYGVRPGHALITMVEPHPGHEYAWILGLTGTTTTHAARLVMTPTSGTAAREQATVSHHGSTSWPIVD